MLEYHQLMRPLLATSVAVVVFGLALGLLNLYIVGRIDATLLLEIIGLIALTAVASTALTRR